MYNFIRTYSENSLQQHNFKKGKYCYGTDTQREKKEEICLSNGILFFSTDG